jgi:hypothetical protein
MMYPNLENLKVLPRDLTHAILLFGGGDLTATLVSQEIWDSWSEQEDATQFTDNIPNELKLEFVQMHDLVNFCGGKGIKLVESVVDYAY